MSNFAANQIYRIMYSSEDLERFYFQYQTEALPHGESLQSFCAKNKVPYNIFQKWFKDTRKKVVEVQVDGAPVITYEEKTKTGDQPKLASRSSDAGAEMAATYHSVIGTVKLHGSFVWNFLGTFFKNIFNGCRDYVNMVPNKITLATCQC